MTKANDSEKRQYVLTDGKQVIRWQMMTRAEFMKNRNLTIYYTDNRLWWAKAKDVL
jgi:hypothetical protein